jgi:DNA-directed RNA polymerase alpha subunit
MPKHPLDTLVGKAFKNKRTVSKLYSNGIPTLEHLLKLSEKDLLSLRGFGIGTVEDIQQELINMGFDMLTPYPRFSNRYAHRKKMRKPTQQAPFLT